MGIQQLPAAGYNIGDHTLVEMSPLVVDSLAECEVDLSDDRILVA
jgi:hypothetical protein